MSQSAPQVMLVAIAFDAVSVPGHLRPPVNVAAGETPARTSVPPAETVVRPLAVTTVDAVTVLPAFTVMLLKLALLLSARDCAAPLKTTVDGALGVTVPVALKKL